MIDIVLLTIPKLEVLNPLIGPAALKAMVEKEGFKALCLDYNLQMWLDTKEYGVEHAWVDNDSTFTDRDEFEKFYKVYLEDIVDEYVERLVEIDPKYIGITLLSHWQHNMCDKFIEKINEKCNSRIVLGGPGIGPTYSQDKLDKESIYAYIDGEGEYALLELLRGNPFYPGINGRPPQQIEDLNNLPFPDYSDFDLSKYSHKFRDPYAIPEGSDLLYITGTRGCIRRCTFCDVGRIWPKFTGKSGKTIALEMKYQLERHPGVTKFYFTDSLINGNQQQLNDLVDTLLKENINCKWGGQFIVRPPNTQTPEMFKRLADAGCERMLLGVENASQRVLNHMKKGMRIQDVYYTLEQCHLNNITVVPMMIVGYPTETEEDFQENIDFLYNIKKYADNGTIFHVSLGPTLRVYEGTPLADHFDEEGIDRSDTGGWTYGDNDQVTRIERWFKMKNKAIELGIPLAIDSPFFLKKRYKNLTGKDIE
jgi:radical SAM superfamily enzyme YgiQ (UPF0313 family)